MSLTKVSYSMIEGALVNVLDFGADPTGATASDTAIAAAIAYAVANKQPTVFLPEGKYLVQSTIVIDKNGVCLQGASSRVSGNSITGGPAGQTYGTRIYYTGSAAAIKVSRTAVTPVPPESTNFIENICIQNMQILCTSAAQYALHCIKPVGCIFRNLTIFGVEELDNKQGNLRDSCIRLEAGVDNIFDFIDLNAGTDDINYRPNGLTATVYLGEPITTTFFRNCYFHYSFLNYIDSVLSFEDCIFEACTSSALLLFDSSEVVFYNCWWEANLTFMVQFGLNTITKFYNCRFANTQTSNLDAYFTNLVGTGRKQLEFNGCLFNTHASQPLQRLFFDSAVLMGSSPATMTITNTIFPSAFFFGTPANADYTRIIHNDMARGAYRFIKTAIAAGNVTVFPMTSNLGSTSYIVPQNGHFLGVNTYTSGATGGGTYNTSIFVNAVEIIAQASVSTTSTFNYYAPYLYVLNVGDIITVYLNSNAITTGIDITVDVVVALGQDGRGIT